MIPEPVGTAAAPFSSPVATPETIVRGPPIRAAPPPMVAARAVLADAVVRDDWPEVTARKPPALAEPVVVPAVVPPLETFPRTTWTAITSIGPKSKDIAIMLAVGFFISALLQIKAHYQRKIDG